MLRAVSDFRVTLKSTPICNSVPDLSFGRILVPRRFQTSGEISSIYQTRSYVPSGFCPDANPKSPLPMNSTILPLNIASGSSSLVRDPFRKLCLRLVRGHAPLSFSAGGQLRSIYPAPIDSFRSAPDFKSAYHPPTKGFTTAGMSRAQIDRFTQRIASVPGGVVLAAGPSSVIPLSPASWRAMSIHGVSRPSWGSHAFPINTATLAAGTAERAVSFSDEGLLDT